MTVMTMLTLMMMMEATLSKLTCWTVTSCARRAVTTPLSPNPEFSVELEFAHTLVLFPAKTFTDCHQECCIYIVGNGCTGWHLDCTFVLLQMRSLKLLKPALVSVWRGEATPKARTIAIMIQSQSHTIIQTIVMMTILMIITLTIESHTRAPRGSIKDISFFLIWLIDWFTDFLIKRSFELEDQ